MATKTQCNSSRALAWLGLIILAGCFFFKWLPDWTWRADLPEIAVNNYIFETRPHWQGETAIIESTTNPTIHIRITPKKAVEERAHLKVMVNDKEVSDNCFGGSDTFCYKIPSHSTADNAEYSVIAKNDAGEAHATIKVVIKDTAPGKDASNNPSSSSSDTTTPTKQTTPSATTPSSSPSVKSACLHSISGLCLDDYEDEAYSAGLYDHSYGYHGTSLDYPDGCNNTCQEYLEDAYEEGWYDAE